MNRIKRIILWLQLYALEITIEGYGKCLAVVTDPTKNLRITLALQVARRERTRLRGEYIATFAPGQRCTWSAA